VQQPAERGQQFLRQVTSLVPDLTEAPRPASTQITANAGANTRLNRRPRI
jgi:hypothetical protein